MCMGSSLWCSSFGLVASGVKCTPHGGKNSGTKSLTVSWLSLKTKVEPGLRGSRVMRGGQTAWAGQIARAGLTARGGAV
jgi:hypothetical protein